MKLTKEEDKVICKFLKNVSDEGGEGLFRLMQFVLMKLSERAIRINVGEVALSQTLNHEVRNTIRVWPSNTLKWVKKLWKNVHTK